MFTLTSSVIILISFDNYIIGNETVGFDDDY